MYLFGVSGEIDGYIRVGFRIPSAFDILGRGDGSDNGALAAARAVEDSDDTGVVGVGNALVGVQFHEKSRLGNAGSSGD